MASCTNPNVVNLDNAQRVDIICRKGDTFSIEIDFYDANNDPIVACRNVEAAHGIKKNT